MSLDTLKDHRAASSSTVSELSVNAMLQAAGSGNGKEKAPFPMPGRGL
jgi:hypothetical protein